MSTTHNKTVFPRAAVLFLLGIIVLLVTRNINAQNSYGSIVGTVTDSSGANVAGAKVSLKNVGTNQTQETTTGPVVRIAF